MQNIYAELLKEHRVISLAASRNSETGDVFRTFLVRFPKILLAELNTHRQLVRNCGSSRAIPTKTFIHNLQSDAYMPRMTGLQAGMTGAELDPSNFKTRLANQVWKASQSVAIASSTLLQRLGIHKQDANRLLEPFTHVDLVLSGTEWDNIRRLRCAPDAQPAFKEIMDKIAYIIDTDAPRILYPGQWHIPFAEDFHSNLTLESMLQVAIARIARVSYMRHGKDDIDLEADFKLAASLLSSGHLSPLEHVAMCVPSGILPYNALPIDPKLHKYLFYDTSANYYRWTRNYAGFYTYRHHIEDKQTIN